MKKILLTIFFGVLACGQAWAVAVPEGEEEGAPEIPPQAVAAVGAAMTGSALWLRRLFK